MFDRWYSAKVIHGLKNGSKFGFPTANLHIESVPNIKTGVYSAVVKVEDRLYKGMLYVGTRPTLKLSEKTFEMHILNFSGDIYGSSIEFMLIDFIRSEIRFDSVSALISQLISDRNIVDNSIDLSNYLIKSRD